MGPKVNGSRWQRSGLQLAMDILEREPHMKVQQRGMLCCCLRDSWPLNSARGMGGTHSPYLGAISPSELGVGLARCTAAACPGQPEEPGGGGLLGGLGGFGGDVIASNSSSETPAKRNRSRHSMFATLRKKQTDDPDLGTANCQLPAANLANLCSSAHHRNNTTDPQASVPNTRTSYESSAVADLFRRLRPLGSRMRFLSSRAA